MSATDIKLLFLSDHLGHEDGRVHGATSYFLTTLPRLAARLANLRVCFLRERHPAATQLEAKGISPIFLDRGRWDPSVVVALIALIRAQPATLVHAAGMKGILAGRVAARRCRIPCIAHLHDMVDPPFPIRALLRLTTRWTTAAIAISDAVRNFGHERLGIPLDRLYTVFSGIDLTRYGPRDPAERAAIRASLGLAPSAPTLITIGRLDALKNPAGSLRALSRILNAMPDVRLLVVGAGAQESELRALARSLGLADHVLFLGHREDVPDLLAASDVMVTAPRGEGLGLAAIESLASGVPVVCTGVGGLPEVVRDGVCGVLVAPDDTESLADAALGLLRDAARRGAFAEAARKQARRFDVETHVRELESLYRLILRDASLSSNTEGNT